MRSFFFKYIFWPLGFIDRTAEHMTGTDWERGGGAPGRDSDPGPLQWGQSLCSWDARSTHWAERRPETYEIFNDLSVTGVGGQSVSLVLTLVMGNSEQIVNNYSHSVVISVRWGLAQTSPAAGFSYRFSPTCNIRHVKPCPSFYKLHDRKWPAL